MKPDGRGRGLVVLGEAQPVRVARVDEQLRRRLGDQDVGLAGVDADVAAPVGFSAQHLGQLVGVGERLTENQSAPTEFEHDVVRHRVDHVRW